MRLLIGLLLILSALPVVVACGGGASGIDLDGDRRVLTYYYYWYDAESGLHMSEEPDPAATLTHHPVDRDAVSYESVAWHRRQLEDMAYAGIDVVLPVYWAGESEFWALPGLRALVQAMEEMSAEGRGTPAVGMFFDTGSLAGQDLTTEEGLAAFYGAIKDFFTVVPWEFWATSEGRPIVWIFALDGVVADYDEESLNAVRHAFLRDFGVEPLLALRPREKVDGDIEFEWGAALNGAQITRQTVAVGPGFDERRLLDRAGVVRERGEGGAWYREQLTRAVEAGSPWLVIETWNQFHEATEIAETEEYGRLFLEITREFAFPFRGIEPPPVAPTLPPPIEPTLPPPTEPVPTPPPVEPPPVVTEEAPVEEIPAEEVLPEEGPAEEAPAD